MQILNYTRDYTARITQHFYAVEVSDEMYADPTYFNQETKQPELAFDDWLTADSDFDEELTEPFEDWQLETSAEPIDHP